MSSANGKKLDGSDDICSFLEDDDEVEEDFYDAYLDSLDDEEVEVDHLLPEVEIPCFYPIRREN